MPTTAKTRAPSAGTYTAQQVALLLGVSAGHVYRLVKEDRFPAKAIPLGNTIRFARSEIQAMLPEENLDKLLREVGGDQSQKLSTNEVGA